MALLFRTELGGGSSIEPYTVIVSLDEKFKGQPVTLTQGTEIMRKTCPMTVPYEVEFKPMNDGVWVASSTTKDGKVVSVDTEPLLEWGTYNVTLKSGFNFKEWLNRGRVEKTFTSLDDVLADQPTVRQLMTVHDSVDYLVTALSNDADTAEKILDNDICAKWINLRDYALDMLYANANVKAVMDSVDKYGYGEWALIGQVPKMTSNTAPSGEVFGGNSSSSSNLWKAFNQNPSDTAAGFSNINEYWIGYDFTKDIKINSVTIRGCVDGGKDSIKDFNIECSSDKINWEIVYSGQHTEVLGYETFTFDNDKSRRYWRIKCTSGTWAGSITGGFSVLQFYAWGAKGAVPVMTSNTAPYGEVIGGEYSGDAWVPWHVFDGDSNTGWATPANKTTNIPIGYKFNNPICIKALYIENITISGLTNRGLKDFKIQYSDDNDTWNDAYSDTLGSGESKLFVFSNAGYHIYWRLLCVNNHGAEYICIYTLQFYGRSLKVSIPKMTSNTEPWGIVTATDYYKDVSTSYDPWRAFTNGTECGWLPANFNDELVYDFGYPVLVKKMTLRNAKQASTETSKVYYDLFGSIDGQKYDLIQNDVNCYTHRNYLFTYSINTNKYRFYKLVCTKNDNGRATSGYGCILQFYGVDYSEKEFAQDGKVKYIYDHGVKLKTIETFISNGGTIDEQSDQILWSTNNKNGVTMLGAKVDVTDKKVARARFGLRAYTNASDGNMGFMILNNTIAWNTPFNAVKTADMPNNANVNFASGGYSGDYYVIFGADFTSAYNVYNTLQELWVE